jgi:hypothetical protein
MERLWGENGFKEVCKATMGLIDSLLEALPTIKDYLKEGRITLKDILYPPFNNTVEVIPSPPERNLVFY